jgi:rhodanese-related sulfurtransferase
MDITVAELKQRLDAGETLNILDVREPEEFEMGNLNGRLIPLQQLPERLAELKPLQHAEIIVHCRSGHRSNLATEFLKSSGFTNPRNLVGGILAWKAAYDPTMKVF